jgi:hypothetical protein
MVKFKVKYVGFESSLRIGNKRKKISDRKKLVGGGRTGKNVFHN